MKRIGIMGGTFNPIHYAHLILAEQAYRQFSLDEVVFIPSKHPPHKDNNQIVDDIHRLNMLKLAINDIPYFSISEIELKRDGITYTADTLLELKKENTEVKYFFILGGDSLACFNSWHEPEMILQNAVILAGNRSSMSSDIHHSLIKELITKYSTSDFIPDIRPLIIPSMDISSKSVRNYLMIDRSIRYSVPEAVINYIIANELYINDQFRLIRSYIKQNLSEHRYKHTLGVADTAVCLAENYGEDIIKAYLAALLHDIGKTVDVKELLKTAIEQGIELSKTEEKQPQNLLHAKMGVYYAKKLFNITDNSILNCIKYHTTGRPNMSMLEKIIFISDYIEPGRVMQTNPDLDIIRSTAYTDINKAIKYELINTIGYLKKNNIDIDESSIMAYNFYKEF